MFKHIAHVLRTKGGLLALRRLFDIVKRFLFGRRRFIRLLRELDLVFVLNQIKGSFFITAVLLKRHSKLIEKLRAQGHCLAIHGYHHIRMNDYSPEVQADQAAAAAAAFKANSLDPSGFRPPYLSFNEDTLLGLKNNGFRWTSYQYLLDRLPGTGEGAAGRLHDLYHIYPLSDVVSIPHWEGGMVDIPITGPDDELMIDRYRIFDPGKILSIWLDTWRKCHQRGELYHLMYHPERFLLLSPQITSFIAELRKESPSIWFATLGEIGDWWIRRSSARPLIVERDNQAFAYFKDLPEGAVILLSKQENSGKSAGNGFLEKYEILEPVAQDSQGLGFIAGKDGKKYVIGLTDTCREEVENCLRNEGYLTMRGLSPQECSLYIDGSKSFTTGAERNLLEAVESCPEPLLRLWRWPEGYTSAVTFSADICAIDFWDFVARSWHFGRD